ncbi:MAG: flagellar biosynthetic protein FliO [Syntrophomonas sp.]
MIAVLSLVVLHILAASVGAVDNINELNNELQKQQEVSTQSSSLWVDFLKLIVVLALIIGVAWSLIKVFSKQVSRKMQGTWLQVVDEVMLGQNRGVVLCEIGEKLYALGVTDHTISFLFEVNNPGLLQEISQSNINIEEPQAGFDAIRDRLVDLVIGRKGSSPGRKNFRLMMNEQAQRLENISYKSTEDNGAKRSGDDA